MPVTPAAEPVPLEPAPARPAPALPGFGRLATSACSVGALPFALLLIAGRPWLALSVALGVGVSVGVCGLLFLFVERAMPVFFGSARDRTQGAAAQGSQLQFLLLLVAKLAFIALVGALFLTLRHVSPVAVIVGFSLGQAAIVVSALRFRRPD